MDDAQGVQNKNIALIAITIATFLIAFISSAINVALPTIGKEFAVDALILSWVATSYILISAMFMVPLGKVADIYGRKKVFIYGILIFNISSLLCALSRSIAQLLCFRIIQGLGSAMVFGTCMAILTSIFVSGERGKALGINISATYMGLSLGPVLGGIFTQHLGWRSIFLVTVLFGFLSFLLLIWKLEGEWADARGQKFDFVGSLIYSISLVSALYGLSIVPAAIGKWLIIAGVAGIILFAKWETKIDNPVLNIDLFKKNRVFTFSNMAALINYSATAAIGFLLSLYLQYIKVLDPQSAGLILVSQPLVMALFSPLAGRLSDRVEPRLLASSGMAVIVLGLIPLIFLGAQTPSALIISSLVVLGFGFALFSSPNTNAVMSSVQKNFYGIASATLATMRTIGQLLSMGIVMLVLSLNIGKTQITPENHVFFLHSLKISFIIFAFLCFIGVFASLARGRGKAIDFSSDPPLNHFHDSK